jgi:hypothetical protein
LAPLRANVWATAPPIAPPAPWITATLSLSNISIVLGFVVLTQRQRFTPSAFGVTSDDAHDRANSSVGSAGGLTAAGSSAAGKRRGLRPQIFLIGR